jgi:hypothetical protein
MTLNKGRSRTHSWDVYWSPEGRKIATVEAITARQAIRKAPQPYRRYLGEMYAQLTPNSFKAVVVLHSDGYLLGGAKYHESTPFVSREDATTWGQQSLEVNKGRPGYEAADISVEIMPVYHNNPIAAFRNVEREGN